ncbi:MAG: hypothetical protein GF317_12780 [Candidatus Lokiarchaeota archaeon]|nr:hypothetical protein [Candidatus Lokiarchaeota archaeon]MBD3200516.1 hypothetical protein [Candidatus Lokiarchaeota archaeon]
MATSKAEIEKVMYILTILGGLIGILEAVIGLTRGSPLDLDYELISNIVAIIIAVLAIMSAIKPDNPIPFNWIIILVFSILLIIFGSIIGGVLMLVGALLGLFSEADFI